MSVIAKEIFIEAAQDKVWSHLVDPGRAVSFTFGGTKVEVRIHAQEGGAAVELVQSGMKDDLETHMRQFVACRGGWIYFLTILRGVMEHGIDTRDKRRATAASFSVDFDPRTIGLD